MVAKISVPIVEKNRISALTAAGPCLSDLDADAILPTLR